MNRKAFLVRTLVGILAILLVIPPFASAQNAAADTGFTQAQLDQMLAPIALYPDALLAQILVAATFPNQVVEADQWVQDNSNLHGQQLNAALDQMNWDLSVKALVPFPRVLDMMAAKLQWTDDLGQAFLADESGVMNSIQQLRWSAYAQGNLRSTEQQRVLVRGESIEIEPANPELVYVPVYNPDVIYGSWWYPAYPPFAFSPFYPDFDYNPYYTWPGYIPAGAFGFGVGVTVASGWDRGWGYWDWRDRDIHVNLDRNININSRYFNSRNIRAARWREANRQALAAERRSWATRTGLRAGALRNQRAATLRNQRAGAFRNQRAGLAANRPSVGSVERALRQQRAGKIPATRGLYSNRRVAGNRYAAHGPVARGTHPFTAGKNAFGGHPMGRGMYAGRSFGAAHGAAGVSPGRAFGLPGRAFPHAGAAHAGGFGRASGFGHPGGFGHAGGFARAGRSGGGAFAHGGFAHAGGIGHAGGVGHAGAVAHAGHAGGGRRG